MLSGGLFWLWMICTVFASLGLLLYAAISKVQDRIEAMGDYDDVETDLLVEDETAGKTIH